MSQYDLAEELGVSRTAVGMWEIGARNITKPIQKLLFFIAKSRKAA